MGAQLPWDDSTSSDNPLANNDGTRSAADGRRAGRMGDMRDHGGRHMRDGDRPGAGQGRIGRAIAGPRELVVLAAEKLGMSVADLIDDVRSGKSIADIAGEKNVDVQDVIDALVDEVVQGATEMISDLVNRRIPIPQNSPES
jgi:hypothetical protein